MLLIGDLMMIDLSIAERDATDAEHSCHMNAEDVQMCNDLPVQQFHGDVYTDCTSRSNNHQEVSSSQSNELSDTEGLHWGDGEVGEHTIIHSAVGEDTGDDCVHGE